jgi:hypothetical protein
MVRHPARHSSTTILWRFASAIRPFSKNYPRDLAPQSARLHRTPSISAAPSDQIPQNYGSWVRKPAEQSEPTMNASMRLFLTDWNIFTEWCKRNRYTAKIAFRILASKIDELDTKSET